MPIVHGLVTSRLVQIFIFVFRAALLLLCHLISLSVVLLLGLILCICGREHDFSRLCC